MSELKKVSWGRRNLEKSDHWEVFDLDTYSPGKPVVVCIGGNGTTTDESANGVCKLVENNLQIMFDKKGKNQLYENVDIISAVYPVQEDSEKGAFSVSDTNEFVDRFLIKLLQDENDELVPLGEACRRLSQVTFFTFCRGHLEVEKIMKSLYKELKVLGYSQQERDVLMLSAFEISFAPLTYGSMIPVMFVDSKQDQMLNSAWKNNETSIHIDDNLNGIAVRYEKYGDPLLSGVAVSEAIFDSIHIYSSRLRNNIESDEHNLSLLKRDNGWNSKYEPNADCVSQMIAWVLSRAVENGIENHKSKKFIPIMSLEDLMTEVQMIQNDFSSEQLMSKE